MACGAKPSTNAISLMQPLSGRSYPICVVGSLKPTEWQDKNTNELKHGLNITVSNALTVYEVKKRRGKPKPDQAGNPAGGYPSQPQLDDELNF